MSALQYLGAPLSAGNPVTWGCTSVPLSVTWSCSHVSLVDLRHVALGVWTARRASVFRTWHARLMALLDALGVRASILAWGRARLAISSPVTKLQTSMAARLEGPPTG